MLPLAILAGGLGTRLGAMGRRTPKSLLPAGGALFIDYQLAWAARQGVRRVVLCLGHRAASIRRHVRVRAPRGMEIEFSDEGRPPRGTAAALRLALPRLGARFLVLYGDSYLPVRYPEVERAQRAARRPALMVVYRNAGRYDRSNVDIRGRRVARYVPGGAGGLRWIDAGLSVLTPAALGADPAADLPPLMARLVSSGLLACRRTRQRFYEVGSRRGLAEFRRRAARIRAAAGW